VFQVLDELYPNTYYLLELNKARALFLSSSSSTWKQICKRQIVEVELNFEFFEFYHFIFLSTIWAQKHFAYAHNIRYVMLW